MARECTDAAPLLSSFVFDGVRYLPRFAILTLTSSVPLWNERPACEQNELLEDLRPFVRMSFRPEISAGSAPILPNDTEGELTASAERPADLCASPPKINRRAAKRSLLTSDRSVTIMKVIERSLLWGDNYDR